MLDLLSCQRLDLKRWLLDSYTCCLASGVAPFSKYASGCLPHQPCEQADGHEQAAKRIDWQHKPLKPAERVLSLVRRTLSYAFMATVTQKTVRLHTPLRDVLQHSGGYPVRQ